MSTTREAARAIADELTLAQIRDDLQQIGFCTMSNQFFEVCPASVD